MNFRTFQRKHDTLKDAERRHIISERTRQSLAAIINAQHEAEAEIEAVRTFLNSKPTRREGL